MRKSEKCIPENNKGNEHLNDNISLNNDNNFYLEILSSNQEFFKIFNCYEDISDKYSNKGSSIEDEYPLKAFTLEEQSPFSNHHLNSEQINGEFAKKINTSLQNNILNTESDKEYELVGKKTSPTTVNISSADFEETCKRGRKKKNSIKPKAKYHSKNRKDNRKIKIKVHFLNFIIDFTNAIIKGQMFGAHNILFRKLPHSEKKRYSH